MWQLALTGEIDLETVPHYAEQIAEVLEVEGVGELVLDLGRVTFMGSVGLGMLVTARNKALAANIELKLKNVPPRVHTVLELTSLHLVFDIV